MSNKRYHFTQKEFQKLEEVRGQKLNVSVNKHGTYRCRASNEEIALVRGEDTQQEIDFTEDSGEKLGCLPSVREKQNVSDMGDYFEIMLKNGDSYTITKEKVLEVYEAYTKRNTTIDKACIALGITRTDFMIIKQAFHLTKSSYRYPDFAFTAENYDVNTMTEYENQSRKIDFIQNVARKKRDDQEKRLKRYDTVGYWHDKAIQELKELAKRPVENLNFYPSTEKRDTENILVIADTHLGIKSNNPFNTYDVSIAENRFKQITQWMYDNHSEISGSINVLDLGDAISGYIHGSLKEQNEIPVTTQLKMYIGFVENLLVDLSKISNVTYRICCGNHARIYENKQDDINEANLETLIPMYLSARLSNHPRIKIFDQSPNMIVGSHEIKLFDYYVGAEHGNRCKFSDASSQWNSMYKRFYKEILMGHYHCRKSYVDNGTLVESFPSISGTDEFAANIKKSSQPEATLLTYTPEGRSSEQYIYLK